jgi:hypothetical protein
MSQFGPDTFGDGIPRPQPAHALPDDGLPKLADTLDADGNVLARGAYTLALEAQRKGEPYVFIEASGAGRQWAPTVTAFGVRGLVVARQREQPSAQALGQGKAIDSGAIGRIVIRFPVVEIMLAYKREEMKRLNPERKQLRVNQRRRRPRNVMIR